LGPRLVFDTSNDLCGRCDIASVRLTRDEPGYDDGAVIPSGDWEPLTAADAARHRADKSTPDSVRIELVHRSLPHLDPDDLAGRFQAAASLDPLDGRWPTQLLGCTVSPTPRTYANTSRQDTRCGACASVLNRATGTSPRPSSCPMTAPPLELTSLPSRPSGWGAHHTRPSRSTHDLRMT
jgi:hypothetical protein